MPFEPLQTDEPVTSKGPKVRDLDSQMLAGCGTFVVLSLLTYFLAIWPHLAFFDTYRIRTLAIDCGIGMLPALLAGAVATRKWGLPAAGGFISGALAGAIFLLLRLKQIVLMEGTKDLPQPEFPANWQYLIPAVWMLAVMAAIAMTLKKEEISIR